MFCDENAASYRELLEELGFHAGARMLVMEKELEAPDGFRAENSAEEDPADKDPEGIREIDLRDPAVMDEYMRVNEEAFVLPDSREDMLFRTAYLDAHVYARTEGSRLLSAVTIWPLSEDTGATENVFTAASERRKGNASAVLRRAWRELWARGFKKARLNAYENVTEAVALYEKLGYRMVRRILEMTLGEEET